MVLYFSRRTPFKPRNSMMFSAEFVKYGPQCSALGYGPQEKTELHTVLVHILPKLYANNCKTKCPYVQENVRYKHFF